MKKLLGYISLFAVLFVAGLAVSSCIINDTVPEDQTRPDILITGASYTLSFPSITGMKYANIIRERSTSEEFETIDKRENIGQVVPADLKILPLTFQFEDAYTTPAYFYRYQVRYFNGSFYSKTQYTKIYEGKGSGEAVITTDPIILKCIVNEKEGNYFISLDTDTVLPEHFVQLDYIATEVSSEDVYLSKPFKLDVVTEETEKTAAPTVMGKALTLDLQKTLSTDLLDKKITIDYVIGVKTKKELSDNFTEYYWTVAKPATVSYFYTDSKGTSAVWENDYLIVPAKTNPDNGFDFLSNRR